VRSRLCIALDSNSFRAGIICRFLLVFEGRGARAKESEREMALRDAAQALRRHIIQAD